MKLNVVYESGRIQTIDLAGPVAIHEDESYFTNGIDAYFIDDEGYYCGAEAVEDMERFKEAILERVIIEKRDELKAGLRELGYEMVPISTDPLRKCHLTLIK